MEHVTTIKICDNYTWLGLAAEKHGSSPVAIYIYDDNSLMENYTMKECTACNKELEPNMFPIRKSMPDGHRSKCKACTNKRKRDMRQENPSLYRDREILYRQTEQGKKAGFTSHRRFMINHPEKYSAYKKVTVALRYGRLTRLDRCQGCGDKCKPHGHHEDYSKPLDLTWLCPSCHLFLHRMRTF